MDVSPKQLVSIAAALIPFLEHDDANRALMGSNMQRQAVPLLVTEAPLVSTGLEYRVARDSRAVMVAEEGGKVASVTGNQIIVTGDGKLPEGKKKIKHDPGHGFGFIPSANSCARTPRRASTRNPRAQGRAREKESDHRRRPLHAKRRAGARAQRARRVHAVNGYNFEDAIMISEKIVKEDIFTSIHIDEFEVAARDTKLGPEEITRDIPNLGDEALKT